MNRGNDVTEAMNGQNAAACGGEAMEGAGLQGTGDVLPNQGEAAISSAQPSPSTPQITATNPLQQFMVTGQVQQVQVQQMHPVQNVTLSSPQQVTSQSGQPQQLLAHMQGLRVPVSAATAAATVGPQAIPFTLSPSAAAVLSQHGLTTQALSRLYATTVSSVAPTSGGGGMQVATTAAAAAAQVGQSLQRQLSTGSAGMMVVPQLSPTAGFQQVVSQSPTISASGHGTTTTALLLTPTQDARELQITRQTQAAQPVTQIQLTASFPATSTVSASGGTIHHHGQSPTRGSIPPLANPVQHQSSQQNLMASMNLQQQFAAAGIITSSVSPSGTQPTLVTPASPAGQQQQQPVTPTTPQGQSIRRLSSPGNLSPGASSQRTSPLLSFGHNTQRTSPIHSPERVRKRIKLEEIPPATPELANYRKLICDEKLRQMKELKENYNEHLSELFFLQTNGNYMDYHAWKKRPTVQLLNFLKSGNLDSDEDDETPVGTETKINDEKKNTITGITPLATTTEAAPSTSSPASQSQGSTDPSKKLGGRHGMVFGHVQPASVPQTPPLMPGGVPLISTPTTSVSTSQSPTCTPGQQTTVAATTSTTTPSVSVNKSLQTTVMTTTTVTTSTSVTPNHSSQLAKVMAEAPSPATATTSVKTLVLTTPSTTVTTSMPSTSAPASVSAVKSASRPAVVTMSGRLSTRQHSISAVYDTAIGSQEAIVERAKQEAQVMQRVAELRKEGLWSSRRLPKVQEPPRNKAHWDYLLEEMQWLAADFAQERKWKKAGARKIARMIMKYFQEQQQKELRAEKEEANRTKRIASNMAKMVKEFWSNIEKVVQYKQQSRLEEKRKKALDLHLSFIVDQTEKYSSWLTEGLQGAGTSSIASSSVPASPRSAQNDNDFEPDKSSESDDEETIAKAEKELQMDENDTKAELDDLERESLMPLDELLSSLPKEILEKPASLEPSDRGSGEESGAESPVVKDEDEEFQASEDSDDNEESIAAQEKKERRTDHKEELQDLEAENDLPIEELYKRYAGAYEEDFEAQLSENSTDIEDSEESEEDDEEEEESEEEEEEEEAMDEDEDDGEVGMEYLLNPESDDKVELENAPELKVEETSTKVGDKSPSRDISDIAATAQSLQPTGYTLETTRVITPVPFLLKHSLREYQHVGLDWMATLHDRKLNGILADEMGLGKTIQTIALLAHLACEKEVWGPHLIVVPTSVMLNWEMEFKKWCPAFKILTYYGNQKERKLKRQGWTKTNAFHVCITSYKLVIQDHQAFRRKKWKYFILDEAQNIKNFKSQRWQTLLNFQSQRRLLLTGTPLQNSLMELWSLMHFLMPHVFASHREFKEWFSNPLSGMIEGSREYNESLIKRLHKVLRPFLLRRLKADVEKQMPKKYEHVVMCKLSKRQRFLYDDFMSQAKTKETLASGHFMSVINILMQLRKVCNHPNLFDPRPVLTPFQQEGISYTTASLVLRALEKNPLHCISPMDLHPCLAQLELSLPVFAAHRIRKLQTTNRSIKCIDSQPDSPLRLKPLDKPAKLHLPRSQSPLPQGSGRASPAPQPGSLVTTLSAATPTTSPAITASPLNKQTVLTQASTVLSRSGTPTRAVAPLQVIASTTNTTTPAAVTTTQLAQLPGHTPTTASLAQARMATPHSQSTLAIVSASPTSSGNQQQQAMPITVQIHQTQQGTRLMIPSGQISQLPAGFIQIVQTASGQQIIAAQPTQAGQALQMSQASQLVTNGPATTLTSTPATTLPVITHVSTASGLKSTASLSLPTSPNTSATGKPVVRVSPLAQTPASTSTAISTSTSTSTTNEAIAKSTSIKSGASTNATTLSPNTTAKKILMPERRLKQKSPFYLESLETQRDDYRKWKLSRIADINNKRCDLQPLFGQDLQATVNIYKDFRPNCDKTRWKSLGYLYCHDVHHSTSRTDNYWRRTSALSNAVNTPEQYLKKLEDVLRRFVIYVPSVTAPGLTMHASHPPPSQLNCKRMFWHKLQQELSPAATGLHPISTSMTIQCPEARLIQYDCGKLQTLDILLRQLKSGSHRVLIFTQMTKMLDVLEAFLNYHGHRYLRLDGTTHVEQRQVLMERFNMDKRIFVFILSTRSGGIGVNLTGADTVIFYDSDWNPTMDAQAQDRCHRIGQTRDVHIYRLISERTVEENILKKANQKRLMSDVAIEGGNFTTAFFRDSTIKDLFAEPSGLDQLAKEKKVLEKKKEEAKAFEETKMMGEVNKLNDAKPDLNNSMTQEQIEQALCNAEDETDVQAAKFVAAEQQAELAEFDENIPWDEKEEASRREEEEVSKVEQELAMLEKELTSVERYAVSFMEGQMSPLHEELERAEEEVALAKEEWEFNRLKELRAEEERRAELEEDEMLFTYSRQDAYNQVFICDETGEQLPIWSPPTPPQDDNDVYIDQTICFLYEPVVMPESQLPPIYIKKEPKRPRVEAHAAGRKQKVRKDDQPRVPRSLFDRPSKPMMKMKPSLPRVIKPQVPTLNRPLIDAPDQPEWLIHEDWALLQAVQMLLELPLHLQTNSPAHIPNWDLVADVVNTQSRTYRSPKQCKNRYENIIIPREEGKILYDINPRKQKKSKGIYKTKNNRPMKTSQLYVQDNNGSITTLYTMRFESTKSITAKRSPTLRPTLANPTLKNPKHAAVLAESGISYDAPMTPIQVAAVRAERIAKEKKQQQAAAQEQLQQQQQQQQQGTPASTTISTAITTQATAAAVTPNVTAAVVTAAATGQPQMTIVQGQPLTPVATTAVLQAASMPKGTVTAVSLARSLGAAGSIVVNTAGGVTGNTFATINKRVSQSVAGTPIQVTPAAGPRTLTPQNLNAAIANQQRVSAVTAAGAGATSQVITTTTLTPGTVVAQRVASTTATSVTPGTVQQALTTTTRTLTPQQHMQYLRRAALLKQQQQQQLRQQGRVPALQAEQLKQQQQLKRLQAQAVQQAVQQQVATTTVVSLAAVQKTVAVTTPLITSVAQSAQVTQARLQAPKQSIKRPFAEDMAALLRRQQKAVISTTQPSAGAQQVKLAGAQIITGAQVQQVVGQAASSSQPVATLVKTVSSPSGALPSVTIPVSAMSLGNVNISVSVPPHKTSATKATPQQLRQLQQIHLQRKLHQQGGHKVSSLTANQVQQVTKAQLTAPLIIQQQQQQILKQPVSVQQFQQIMQQQKAAQQATQAQAQQQGTATIQQIITSVAPPTTTATVIATQLLSQGQTQPVQTVTKVSLPMSMGTTLASQPTRTTTPMTVTSIPSSNTVTVMSHGVPAAIASPSATISSPTVTLTPSQQTTLVKHVQDNIGSPNKTLPVTQATIAQLKAVQQQVAVGRQVSGLAATSMQGQTVHVAQVPGVQTQIKGPSVAVQQAVQQVQAQAQQQRQQAVAAVHAAQAGSITVSSVGNTNTTMVQVTPQGQVVQTVPQSGAANTQDPKSAQSTPYTMRLRNPPKH